MDQDRTHVPDHLLELLLVGAIGPTEGGNPVSSLLKVFKELLCFGEEGVSKQLLQPSSPHRTHNSKTDLFDLKGECFVSRIDPVVSGSV